MPGAAPPLAVAAMAVVLEDGRVRGREADRAARASAGVGLGHGRLLVLSPREDDEACRDIARLHPLALAARCRRAMSSGVIRSPRSMNALTISSRSRGARVRSATASA